MSKNSVQKTIIKHLAKAHEYALEKTLQDLPTDAEKDEAKRIFLAVGITKKDNKKDD